MPTFTAIALENLLEPAVGDSSPKNRRPLKQLPREDKPPPARRPLHSPALYTTPKSTPVPTSPVSVSPSPYIVVNRRRRDVREPENRLNGFQLRDGEAAQRNSGGGEEEGPVSPAGEMGGDGGGVEEVGESLGKGLDEGCGGRVEEVGESLGKGLDEGCGGGEVVEGEEEAERADDDCLREFAERCDAASVARGCDTDDGVCLQRGVWKHASASSQNEFFDASEEFLSDSAASSPSVSSDLQADLHAIRLSLFEEIERRKKAETALRHMHKQWQIVADYLSQIGLSFPLPSDIRNLQLELNSVEQFCQEVTVARFVSEAVGRGIGKAEAETSAQEVIVSKKREISRLQDKLQYYEAVNREMCQRNKEVKEMSRQQRRSRKTRQKWMWGCIGLSITLGASVLVFSYLPRTGKQLLLPAEASSTSSSAASECGKLHP